MSKKLKDLMDKGYSEEQSKKILVCGAEILEGPDMSFKPEEKQSKVKKVWNWIKDNKGVVIAGSASIAYMVWCGYLIISANRDIKAQNEWIEEHLRIRNIRVDGDSRVLIMARDFNDQIGDMASKAAEMISKKLPDATVVAEEIKFSDLYE